MNAARLAPMWLVVAAAVAAIVTAQTIGSALTWLYQRELDLWRTA